MRVAGIAAARRRLSLSVELLPRSRADTMWSRFSVASCELSSSDQNTVSGTTSTRQSSAATTVAERGFWSISASSPTAWPAASTATRILLIAAEVDLERPPEQEVEVPVRVPRGDEHVPAGEHLDATGLEQVPDRFEVDVAQQELRGYFRAQRSEHLPIILSPRPRETAA